MHIQIRRQNLTLDPAAREDAERRLRFALGRFNERISQVTVSLRDANGPRGGVDKECRLVVRLLPSGTVTIAETHTSVPAAVALAAERAGRAVDRELKRRRAARYAPMAASA